MLSLAKIEVCGFSPSLCSAMISIIAYINQTYKNCFFYSKNKCNFAAIVKKNRKYSVNIFSRLLVGLLAVLYVSIFVIEAIHGHENLIETSSSDDVKSGLNDNCIICAYFAHHEKKEIAISNISSIAPIVFQTTALSTFEVTKEYQTYLQDFANRGPPCLPI